MIVTPGIPEEVRKKMKDNESPAQGNEDTPWEEDSREDPPVGAVPADAPKKEPTASIPFKLEEMERLRVENVQLKLMAIDQSIARFEIEFEKLQQERHQAAVQYNAVVDELREKYEFDPASVVLNAETGMVVPRPPMRGRMR